jgi:hypothetical protein
MDWSYGSSGRAPVLQVQRKPLVQTPIPPKTNKQNKKTEKMHTYNPSIQESEARRIMSLKPAWVT